MNHTHRIAQNTALTRLISCCFAVLLLFAGLTTTGCGLLDSNDTETIEFVAPLDAPADGEGNLQETGNEDSAAPVDDEEGYPDGEPAPPENEETCGFISGREVCS